MAVTDAWCPAGGGPFKEFFTAIFGGNETGAAGHET
jgi:hypothetical protein